MALAGKRTLNCNPAKEVAQAVAICLRRENFYSILELTIPNGRRFDVVGLNAQGRIIGVEVKVSSADWTQDLKWSSYVDHCDAFYIAVTPILAKLFIPNRAGLIVIDDGRASIKRMAPPFPMREDRRAAMLQCIALTAYNRYEALSPR
jgi:hypothetical protein